MFLMHVLPKGFVRIRHYGLLSCRNKKEKMAHCRKLLNCIQYISNKIAAYVICGICAAIAGIVFSSRIGFVTATSGNGYEMKAVAACVLGGISLSGGVGSVIGSSVGAIIMASISRLLVFMGFGSTYDNAITGIMLIVIVVADALMQRRSAEMNRRQRLAARTAGTANEKGGAES